MLIFLANLSGFGDKTTMPAFIVVNLLFSRETNTVYLTAVFWKYCYVLFSKGESNFWMLLFNQLYLDSLGLARILQRQ